MKKIFALIVLGFVTIGIVAWLANYLSTGTIAITSDDKNDTITLQKTSGGEPFTKIGMGSLATVVKHGRYTATVKNGVETTVQGINFSDGHKAFHYSVSLADLARVEPVAYENARAITATAHQLVYLGTDANADNDLDTSGSGMLYGIDAQNNLVEFGSDRDFQTVKWASSSFGVGQDNDARLYTIINGSTSPLKVPFPYDGKAVNFDVAPDKTIYVSHGGDVYAGDQTGSFTKIYTATGNRPALAAGTNEVAVSDNQVGADPDSNLAKPLLATINVSGKESQKSVESERLAWSPNGQYLVTVNQSSPTIYDATLHQVAVIATSSVVGQFAWLNNNTLLYTINDELWTYNLPDQKAQLLADMPFTASITGLSTTSDGSYVYATTFDSNSSTYAIKRIGLKGQKVPDYIYKLQDILPEQASKYSLSLVNFSGPPEIIVSVAPSNIPTQDELRAAINDLKGRGFDTSELRFDVQRIEP